ncbi:hypothetical protein [Hahella ganghwensis]|uniref:hypothetical protein n=1 Tax=Hahella ganghwensis TaxID=286420 RepID=UPI0003724BA4|nr:hypothetical protein [Hahella ganghwensis]
MKYLLLMMVAAVASASSFIVHVATVEWLPAWIGNQMQGIGVQPSWDIRYIAGLTSIEYGLAASAFYLLARDKLILMGRFKTSLLFATLLAAIHGALLRQPIMDYVIGNPLLVVLVQNSFQWLVWLLMSFLVIYGVEIVMDRKLFC